MRIGIVAPHDGRPGRMMSDLRVLAAHVEAVGIDSMWFPEHVVFFRQYTSKYPYSPDGAANFGRRAGTYDPLFAATVAAGVTTRLRVGTSILIVPERNPVVLAQEIVAVDHASEGRFDLGVGIGWSAEEFAALGIAWERRGARTDDALDAMCALWRDEVVSHDGPFVSFDDVIAEPKPLQRPHPPIWVGGGRGAAMRRAVQRGDGWYGWQVRAGEIAAAMRELDDVCVAAGRDPATVGRVLGIVPDSLNDVAPYIDMARKHGVGEVVVGINVHGDDPRRRVDEMVAAARR